MPRPPFDLSGPAGQVIDWLIKRLDVEQVTSLPANPSDGQMIDYVADATNGIVWRFRYRAASASSFKWEFIGGAELRGTDLDTGQSTASTSYVDLTTVGPSVTVPLAGDYDIHAGVLYQPQATLGAVAIATVKLGSAAASDNERIGQVTTPVAGTMLAPGARKMRRTLAASDVVKMQYRVSTGTGTFFFRWMTVVPVRVG